MKSSISRFFLVVWLLCAAVLPLAPARGQGAAVELLDLEGTPISGLVDGNQVRLRVALVEPLQEGESVIFRLRGHSAEIANCQVSVQEKGCTTAPFTTLGWYWEAGGQPVAERVVEAYRDELLVGQTAPLMVRPRPVVMVHGFSSSWEAWQTYLGPQGFLASIGLQGFAVGDEQVEGVLNTGSITDPEGRTNTIAENAAILGIYIAQVKAQTGAEMVDLVAHSMGGLISRYYIGKVMEARDVAQLIMLGSPMAGTECSYLPASLGFYLPAVLEIRPSYVVDIFNQQVTDRRGVPFNAVAGVPIVNPVQSPCSPVPSDIVISRPSISAIPLNVTETRFLHTDLNRSPEVFREAVAPLLQTPPGGLTEAQFEAGEANAPPEGLQFSKIFTGQLLPGEHRELVISIEAGLTVARFALYDTSRSLAVEVRGASGNVIELDAEENGLTVVDDPETLIYLGYGFASPRAGEWAVTLSAPESAPAQGAYFALTAVFDGGAALKARTSLLLPEVGQEVAISALVEGGEPGLAAENVQARIQPVGGALETVELRANGQGFQANWMPRQVGLHSIEVEYLGRLPDNTPVQRITFLVIDAQPEKGGQIELLLLACAGALILTFGLAASALLRLRRRARQKVKGSAW